MSEECYACMVGVATGPESHSEGCALAKAPVEGPVVHRVWTQYEGSADTLVRASWQCSCGRSGSCREDDVDLASDRHILPGEQRIDVSSEEGLHRWSGRQR